MKRTVVITITILALAALVACGSTIRTRKSSLVTVTVGSDHVATIDVRDATVWAKLKLLAQGRFSPSQAIAGIPATVQSLKLTVAASDMETIITTASVAGQLEASLVVEVPNGLQRYFLIEGLDASASVLYRGTITADLDGTPVTLTVSMVLAQDTIAPTIVSTVPGPSATSVAINTAVSVLFSEPVDTNTITTSTFTLKDSGGNPVSGSVVASGATATFIPSPSLAYATPYTAEATTGIRDLAGNSLAAPYAWSFVTASDAIPPVFAGLTAVSAPSYTTMQLSWSAATDNVTSSTNMVYLIYQASSPAGENFAAPSYTTAPGAADYTVSGLTPGTAYYFVVRAQDEAGNRDVNTVEMSATYPALFVNATTGNDNTGTGSQAAPYLTITKALTMTAGSEAISVATGTYSGETFPLQLKAGTTLYCTGPNHATVIDASGSADAIYGSAGALIDGCMVQSGSDATAINDQGTSVTINNVLIGSIPAVATAWEAIILAGDSIVMNSSDVDVFSTFITVNGGNPTIRNNTIVSMSGSEGILVNGGNVLVSQNTFTGTASFGYAISIQTGTVTVDSNTISWGVNSGSGAITHYSGSSLISNNTITGTYDGITVFSGSPAITGNSITNGLGNGVIVSDSTGTVSITGNVIKNNGLAGVTIAGGLVSVSSNTIIGNASAGIATAAGATSPTVSITGNTIQLNLQAGIAVQGGSVTATGNSLSCNVEDLGVYINTPIDATNNAWDHSPPSTQVPTGGPCTSGTDICAHAVPLPTYTPYGATVSSPCP